MFSFGRFPFVALLCFATLHYAHCRDGFFDDMGLIIGIPFGFIFLLVFFCILYRLFKYGSCQDHNGVTDADMIQHPPPEHVVNVQQQQPYYPQQQPYYPHHHQQQFGQQPQQQFGQQQAMGGEPYDPPPAYPGFPEHPQTPSSPAAESCKEK